MDGEFVSLSMAQRVLNKDEILKKIMEKVAEGNDRISGGEEKALLLLGNTGSGKSTLAHLLTDKSLQGIFNDETGDIVVDAVEPLESIRISHNKKSETKIPNKCHISDMVNRCKNHHGEVISGIRPVLTTLISCKKLLIAFT